MSEEKFVKLEDIRDMLYECIESNKIMGESTLAYCDIRGRVSNLPTYTMPSEDLSSIGFLEQESKKGGRSRWKLQ